MEKTLQFTFIFFYFNFLLGQNNFSETNGNRKFFDVCTNKNITLEYKLDTITTDVYKLKYNVQRGDWICEISKITNGKIPNNFLKIDRILPFYNKNNPSDTKYLNCNEICDGTEKEHYESGGLKTVGEFENGIPKEIEFYTEDGFLQTHFFYHVNSFDLKKEIHYDSSGDLWFYKTYDNKGDTIIIKEFNENDKLISEEIKTKNKE